MAQRSARATESQLHHTEKRLVTPLIHALYISFSELVTRAPRIAKLMSAYNKFILLWASCPIHGYAAAIMYEGNIL